MSRNSDGFLNFGIDRILQNYTRIPDGSMREAERATFSKSTVREPVIGHLFGKQPDDLQSPFDLIPRWYNFCIPQDSRGFYNSSSISKLHDLQYSKATSIPAAVQRVPMAISFRPRMPGNLPHDANAAAESSSILTDSRQGKRKKTWTRAVFSSLQRKGLERSFIAQQYISKKDRRKLAATLGLTDSQVRIWYANRRMKAKKLPRDSSPSSVSNNTGRLN